MNPLTGDRKPYEPGEEVLEYYGEFKQSLDLQSISDYMRGQFELFEREDNFDGSIDFLTNDHHLGVILRLDQFSYSSLQAHALALYWKDAAKNIGYLSYMSDQFAQIAETHDHIYRHYLKPPTLRSTTFPRDQLFGNLEIRLFEYEGTPKHLRIDAKSYPGPQYKHNNSMGELIEVLAGGSGGVTG